MEVGDPEVGELFGIALALFPSPVQVAFEEAAPVVVSIDVRVARPEHGPCCLRGALHVVFVYHC